jgi:hypothetical protein
MIHNGRDRDSLLMPMDARTIDLMLQYSIQLVRCEPTTHFNAAGTYCTGDGILHDEYGRFHLDPWTNVEWLAFRDNFVRVIMRYWDGKFELAPNRPWYLPRGAQGAPELARITCSLSLGLVDAAAVAVNGTSSSSRGDDLPLVRRSDAQTWAVHPPRPLLQWRDQQNTLSASATVSAFSGTVFMSSAIRRLQHVAGAGNDDSNYGVTLEQREIMGLGDHVTGREARPWISQLRHHLIPARGNRDDAALRFTARVIAPQLITYWDNDWVPPPAAAPPAAP